MPALVPFETIPQLLTGLVAHFDGSDRPALRYKDKAAGWTPITHAELYADALAFAGWLHHVGVRPGDRVAVLSENRPEWAVADLGTQLLGAVNVALYTTLPADQVEYILRDSGARVFVVSTNLQFKKAAAVFDTLPELEHVVVLEEPKSALTIPITRWSEALAAGRAYADTHRADLDALADAVGPDDISALIYTSGTTGVPKGVMLTHANICSNARAALEVFDLRPTDEHLSFLPLSHAFERTAGYVAALAGGCTITYAESIDAVAKNLPEVRPTILISVPRVFEKLYNAIVKSVADAGGGKQKVFAWAVATGKKVAAPRGRGEARRSRAEGAVRARAAARLQRAPRETRRATPLRRQRRGRAAARHRRVLPGRRPPDHRGLRADRDGARPRRESDGRAALRLGRPRAAGRDRRDSVARRATRSSASSRARTTPRR